MTSSPNLSLPYIDANQSQKHVTHNSALQMLDALVALSVVSDSLTAPPASPADGDRHIVAAGATGAWAGQDSKIAAYLAGAWAFLTPKTGWRAWMASRSVALVYSGSAWQSEPSLAGFRNRLRNAAFVINQRGVSGTVTLAAGQYGHDGVKAGASGATYTFAASGIDTTLTISAGSLILPIETSLIEGGVYTLSQAGTAQARVWQGTGSTGSGSYAAAPFTTVNLTAATQTNIEFSSGTILRPQFEPGAYATIFERRPPGVELELCQRYYLEMLVGAVGIATAAFQFSASYIPFPTALRATPTASSPTGGSLYNVADPGEYIDMISSLGFRYLIRSAGAGSFTSAYSKITFSAEI